jgi:valyl-tRNA synthetase
MKDRLYCSGNRQERRKAQTTMNELLVRLLALLKPFIPYTVAEVEKHFQRKIVPTLNVVADFSAWTILFALREKAIFMLDGMKKSAGLNKATDAEVVYVFTEESKALLEPYGTDLEDIVGCGHHKILVHQGPNDVIISDSRTCYRACERSWKRRPDVEETGGGFVFSERDRDVLTEIAKANNGNNPVAWEGFER